MKEINILTDILGKTIKEISGAEEYSDIISLKFTDGTSTNLYHEHSCCEKVKIAGFIGDIEDLIGSPLLVAKEIIEIDCTNYTWMFYSFSTIKGSVVVCYY